MYMHIAYALGINIAHILACKVYPFSHERYAELDFSLSQIEEGRTAVIDDHSQVCVEDNGQQLRAPVQPWPATGAQLMKPGGPR